MEQSVLSYKYLAWLKNFANDKNFSLFVRGVIYEEEKSCHFLFSIFRDKNIRINNKKYFQIIKNRLQSETAIILAKPIFY
jgi:hypothetical protein